MGVSHTFQPLYSSARWSQGLRLPSHYQAPAIHLYGHPPALFADPAWIAHGLFGRKLWDFSLATRLLRPRPALVSPAHLSLIYFSKFSGTLLSSPMCISPALRLPPDRPAARTPCARAGHTTAPGRRRERGGLRRRW